MAAADNPYLPSGLDRLSMMLAALGSGISGAEASGRSGWAGISPAASMYGQGISQANQNAVAYDQWQKNYQLQNSYRQAQEDALKAQTEQRQQELDLTKNLTGMLPGMFAGGGAVTPGMGAPTAQPTIGPGFFNAVGQAESGGNYTVPNAKGSGAYGKYQFMPETWATVAQANPQLGLPFNMRQSTPDQQEAAMRSLTSSNAQGLQSAGIQPTPDNLYLAHRFGVDGAKTVLAADPNKPIASVVPAQWVQQNPDLQGVTVGQFRQQAQQRFAQSGNPQIVPQQGGAAVMPPRVDPMRFLPFTLSKTLAPFGQAGVAIGNSETDRYLKEQQREQERQQFERKQGQQERQDKVTPTGSSNTALIDAETEAARKKAEAEAGVKLDTEAAQKLTEAEMTRYSKETRPAIEATVNSLPNLYEMKRLTEGPLATGSFIDARQTGARILDTLGIAPMSDGMVNRTEFNNRAGKNVLATLQTGALGRTQISEGDRKFVEAMSAKGEFTTDELKRLTGIAIKSTQTQIAQHDQGVERLRKLPGVSKVDPGYFKLNAPSYDDWAKANPLAAPPGDRPPLGTFGSRPPLSSFGGGR